MLGISYLVVLVESGFSSELNFLKNSIGDETAWEYIQKQQLISPKIRMTVECYHERSGAGASLDSNPYYVQKEKSCL